uniref:COMM domain containing 9-like protein n=1 Tax=Philodina roseola TaxID=96448 RepID=B6S329_PHIRO|nr:COMM domain containing 9-like protein [Philodina roseola]
MLPELQDFRWYIDMKLIPSANGQRIQQPSCVLSLDVRDQNKPVQIELSKDTLNLVLENFTRIREQLNALAKRE